MNLKTIVEAKLLENKEKHKYHVLVGTRSLLARFKKHKLNMNAIDTVELFEKWFNMVGPVYWSETLQTALDTLAQTPMQAYNNKTKHFTVPYWNPTTALINIRPLGIPGLEEVQPGDKIDLPHQYTLGQKRSVISSIAPQLQPLPLPIKEEALDIKFISYTEWCMYGKPEYKSKCCSALIVWSLLEETSICQKCGK